MDGISSISSGSIIPPHPLSNILHSLFHLPDFLSSLFHAKEAYDHTPVCHTLLTPVPKGFSVTYIKCPLGTKIYCHHFWNFMVKL